MKRYLPKLAVLHRAAVLGGLALATLATPASAAVVMLGPLPYLSEADSPFNATSFSAFYLENFEDHLLNTPGVSASAGGVTSVIFGPSIHDSVDGDDGVIDGSGLLGDSYYSGGGATGIRFSFDSAVLGGLPTHAGIVWTDGASRATVTFRVYGVGDVLLDTLVASGFADTRVDGGTAEDRFFGAFDTNGISSIFISTTSGGGGIEVDHLQYGLATVATAVPEPATHALLLAGLGIAAGVARRRKPGRPTARGHGHDQPALPEAA